MLFAENGSLYESSGQQHVLGASFCLHPQCQYISELGVRQECALGYCCVKCFERLLYNDPSFLDKPAKEHGKYCGRKKAGVCRHHH